MPQDVDAPAILSSRAAGGIERITIVSGPLTGLAFLRHTIDIAPAEGTVGLVEGDGWRCAGKFVSGEWKRSSGAALARVPTHWSILDPGAKV